jgi:hypothetical protein
VWSGASQLRGELARKARESVVFMLQHMRAKEIGKFMITSVTGR